MQPSEKRGAVAFGFDEDSWDCWSNHYGDYWWTELVEYELDGYFIALGWNENNWNNNRAPRSEEMDWNELNGAERDAARQICYFRDLWDELSIPEFRQVP